MSEDCPIDRIIWHCWIE